MSVMRVIPSTSQEWFSALLRPFEAYTFIGFVFFKLLASYELAVAVVYLYIASVVVLVFGGLVRLLFRPRAAAVPAFIFAACNLFLVDYFIHVLSYHD